MIFAMLMAALNVGVARAEMPETLSQSEPTCEEVLEACELYVTALEDETTQLKSHIGEQDFEIARLQAQIAPTPWYWYVLGGAAAAVVGGVVIK